MPLSDCLYSRGYVYADAANPNLDAPGFSRTTLPNGASLYFRTNLPLALLTAGAEGRADCWICVLGSPVDLIEQTVEIQVVAQLLLKALVASTDTFFDRLDYVSGRYVVVFNDGSATRILADATGMKTIFYSRDGRFFASHARLIVDATGDNGPSPLLRMGRREFKFGFPGLETPFKSVRLLSPNTLFNISSKKVERFFPREELPELSFGDARDLVWQYMNAHVRALPSTWTVVASLTAGIDSRLSLAALRQDKRIQYFTYCGEERLLEDKTVASDISSTLSLQHHLLNVDISKAEESEFAEFSKILRRNSYYSHGHRQAYRYTKTFTGENKLHIRSNLGEIGRTFYQRAHKRPAFSPAIHSSVYNRRLGTNPKVERAFQVMYETNRLDKIWNYDPFDMAYWEHRMGGWHALAVMESDPAFDTHVIFNARCTLKAFLSIPFHLRQNGSLFKAIIANELPELAAVPINPRKQIEAELSPKASSE